MTIPVRNRTQFVLGDGIVKLLEHIVVTAVRKGTPKALLDAEQQLEGIWRLTIWCNADSLACDNEFHIAMAALHKAALQYGDQP